jgi:hypothetical protein
MNAPQIDMITWGVGFGTCPTDDGQTLEDLEISAQNGRYTVRRVTDQLGQAFWLLESDANDRTRNSLTIKYRATLKLNRRVLKNGAPANKPALTDRNFWLQMPEADDKYAAAQWAKQHELVRGLDERDVMFANRLLECIKRKLRFKFVPTGVRGVTGCVKNGYGACGELNALAVAVIKLNNIPARTRPGRNSWKDVPFGPENTDSYHVAAEFWGEGIGWIPIEASAIGTAQNEKGLELKPFLGTADGIHVTKHYNFVHLDNQVRTFQNQDWPFGRWRGKWDGWTVESKYGVSFTSLNN